ncbi:MAG: EAL domain-containing protein [Eubacterium sp.]|nr:EAL domain-containing protein [Eubacterium sp.]
MWDYHLLGPSVCILFVIHIFYVTRPKLPIRSRYTFAFIVLIEALTMLTDYTSTRMDEHYYEYSTGMLYTANSIYFFLFFSRIFLFFMLTMTMLGMNARTMPVSSVALFMIHFVVLGVIVTSNWNHLIFRITEHGYEAGKYYNLLYVYAFFFQALSLLLLGANKGKIIKRKKAVILFYIGIITVAFIVRKTYPQFLVVDFFYVISILVVYLGIENPEFYLNSKTGIFHYDSLLLLLEEWNTFTEYRIIAFSIRGYRKNREMYGPRHMDNCLVEIANFMKKEFRGSQNFYIRDGRFAIVTRKQNTEEMIEKIRSRFEYAWVTDKTEMFLDIGIAEYDSKLKEKPEVVFQAIEEALNESVEQNTETIEITRKTLDKINRLEAVKVALEMALDDYSVEVFLQPVVRTSDFKIVGAESLVRINDGVIGEIRPKEFIPIAEKNGSITRLGYQVFEKTCDFYSKVGKKLGLEWINVNMSPIQFKNRNILMNYENILSKYNLSPNRIHLEITERNIMDIELIRENMESFVQEGFQFSLDDYGSGYSNAISVLNYPLTNVKLDKDVIHAHFNNPTEFLPSELKILKGMDVSVTAEGIETEEMANTMRDFGCDYLQGYYFGRPVSMDEFVEQFG